jgi:hypothetical protein
MTGVDLQTRNRKGFISNENQMESTQGKPILVTGSQRSGTTWVGHMIARSPSVAYIHEPFNMGHRPGICGAQFGYWFPYLCDENGSSYHDALTDCIGFKYQFSKELKAIRSLKDAFRLMRDSSRFGLHRMRKSRALLKDPGAIFSAGWLAKTFDMDVIVMIRHPAAFVGSLKKAYWPFSFRHFLEQSLLMEHHLGGFKAEIEHFVQEGRDSDLVGQGILMWRMFSHVILKYKETHPAWLFIRHEDLSADPVAGFAKIFERLSLDYSQKVQDVIRAFSNPTNPSEQLNGDPMYLKRDSRSNIWNWKKRLTADEIDRIRENTSDISHLFYSEEDWGV